MAKKQVKMGVIGLGNMGAHHIKYINELDGAKLTAIADIDGEKLDAAVRSLGDQAEGVETFGPGKDLIAKGDVDAILIATPHYDHPPLTKQAFKRGLHVLCEKPVAVTAKAAAEVEAAYKKMRKKPIWGVMFQARTSIFWQAVKRILDEGEIGEIKRVSWIITTWFRTQSYYDSGGWRATWAGEGGGVIINQCPHNLDLITWFCGLPSRVTANVGLGKFHKIEVEDDVTAILEYPNGATGIFVTTTGDSPGTNRLEITGDKGKLVAEGSNLTLVRTHESVSDFCKNCDRSFANVGHDVHKIEVGGKQGEKHQTVTQAFVDAINHNDPNRLYAHAADGIKGLELGNAMLMSGILGEPIDIPTPRAKFDKLIKDLAAKSKVKKDKPAKKVKTDINASFH